MQIALDISHLESLLDLMPAMSKLTGTPRESYLAACAALHAAKTAPTKLRVRPKREFLGDSNTNKVSCIKAWRSITNDGLKVAKDAVESDQWTTLPVAELSKARREAEICGVVLEVEEVRQ